MNEVQTSKAAGIIVFLRNWISGNLGGVSSGHDDRKTFAELGMDSIQAMTLVGDLEDFMNRRLSPTLAWDQPSPAAMAAYLTALPEDEGAAISGSPEPVESDSELLDRLDHMSEEEIDRLLAERSAGNEKNSAGPG